MTPRLVLIGAPGAGKTTVGAAVADRLGCTFVDTDELVARAAGQPISDLFVTVGERRVRELEERAVFEALAGDGVVALGSGAPESPSVQQHLAGARVVWLQVGLPETVRRSGLGGIRPATLGNVRAEVGAMLAAREPVYAGLARWSVPTSGVTVADVVARVIEVMEGGSG